MLLGYDSVFFRLDVSDINDFSKLSALLVNHTDKQITGEAVNPIVVSTDWGTLHNLIVTLSESYLTVKGSLAKYMYPTNAITLNWRYADGAISKLSDALGVDMTKATITRLDASASFQMRYPSEAYYPILGEKPFFRSPLRTSKHTLYYNQETRYKSLIFYDKKSEMKSDRQELPPPMQGSKGVLRYEARLIGKSTIEKELNEQQVTGAMLGNKEFFRKVQKYWGKNYFDIKKNPQEVSFDGVRTSKDIVGFILAHYVAKYGAKIMEDDFELLQAVNADRKTRYQARVMVRRILDKYKATKDDLKQELDDAVKQELLYI